MEYKIFKAKTVNDAITDALVELEITSDLIEYEVIEEGSSGLLGLFSKDAVIKARRKEEAPQEEEDLFDIRVQFQADSLLSPQKPKQSKKAPKSDRNRSQDKATEEERPVKAEKQDKQDKQDRPERQDKQDKPVKQDRPVKQERSDKQERPEKPADRPVSGEDVPFSNQAMEDILQAIFRKLGIDAKISMTINHGEHVVNVIVDGDDTGELIGKRGQTLDAIQYLLSILVNKEQEAYYRVKLDTNNYRERRQRTLENLARNVASRVKKTRRKVVLEPMNPYERRVIHAYLQADKYVTTKSEGVEPNRRVVVYYKKP